MYKRQALALGSNVLLVDVFAGTSRLLAVDAQQPDPPIITWLDDNTLLVPRDVGARVVDATTETSFDIGEPAADVATVRGSPDPLFVKLIGGGAGPDESLIEAWQVTLGPSPAQSDPPPSVAGLGGTAERIAVPGPPWMRSWSGPGWWSPSLAARGCDPPAVDMPPGFEAPRGAVTAVWARGHIGTLVSLDSELVPLGFRQHLQLLIAVPGENETQLLGWNPFDGDETRIYRLTTLMAHTDVSLADLS